MGQDRQQKKPIMLKVEPVQVKSTRRREK